MSNKLREKGFAVSVLDVKEEDDKPDKFMLLLEIDSGQLKEVKNIIRKIDKQAFIIVTETKYVQNGYFKSV